MPLLTYKGKILGGKMTPRKRLTNPVHEPISYVVPWGRDRMVERQNRGLPAEVITSDLQRFFSRHLSPPPSVSECGRAGVLLKGKKTDN